MFVRYPLAKRWNQTVLNHQIDRCAQCPVEEVLEYVQYNPKKLVRQLEVWVAKSVKQGKISLEEGKEFLSNYRSGLYGYTYLE